MSLTDPIAAVSAKRAKQGRTGWTRAAVILLALLVVDLAVSGYILGRSLTQNGAEPPGFGLVLIPPVSMALIIGWGIVSTSRALPSMLGFGAALTAGGLALALSSHVGWQPGFGVLVWRS